jgi:enoyl-CoA hydratase/carnithine racemase
MEFVEVAREESVAVVTLNRPPVNAMTEDFARELGEAFTECADPQIRSVVVTGQPHFAAGADIKGFQATFDAGVEEERSAWTLQESIGILESLEKPTIAAVHGYALGGGLELAMGADFRFLAEDARVGQPEILLGLIPGAGGTQRLARIVGYQRAKELVLTGRQVDAKQALDIGLADQVLPSAELLDVALEAAREWATKATRAIATAKTALNTGFGRPVSEGLLIERDAFNQSFKTEDAREGVAAFIAKREADFKGR